MTADDDWFESLAGRDAPGAAPEDRLEGRLLRAALRRAGDDVPHAAAPPDIDALLHAVRGAAPDRSGAGLCPGCAERWRRLRDGWRGAGARRRWAGLGAAVACGVVALAVVGPLRDDRSSSGDPTVPRGSQTGGVTLLGAAEPAQRRDRIADMLEADGARVRRYARLGRQGLDAELQRPVPPATVAALAELGVAVPPDGSSLRLEWEARNP